MRLSHSFWIQSFLASRITFFPYNNSRNYVCDRFYKFIHCPYPQCRLIHVVRITPKIGSNLQMYSLFNQADLHQIEQTLVGAERTRFQA